MKEFDWHRIHQRWTPIRMFKDLEALSSIYIWTRNLLLLSMWRSHSKRVLFEMPIVRGKNLMSPVEYYFLVNKAVTQDEGFNFLSIFICAYVFITLLEPNDTFSFSRSYIIGWEEDGLTITIRRQRVIKRKNNFPRYT